MHTLHYVAVEAETAKQAFEQTVRELNGPNNYPFSWSDWHVVGGGRWSSNKDSQYNDAPDGIVSFATDPEEYKKYLAAVVVRRQSEVLDIQRLIALSPEDLLYQLRTDFQKPDLWPSPFIESKEDPLNMKVYYLKKIIGLISGEYGPESGYFDLVSFEADIKYARERIVSEDAGKQYLVPIDFHY